MSSAPQQQNIAYRFVSDFPFKDRAPDPRVDSFEKDALKLLREIDEDLTNVTSSMLTDKVRFIAPVIMGAACVSCHNSHPDSPKRDWKVGDVRAIQEISITQAMASNIFSFRQEEESISSSWPPPARPSSAYSSARRKLFFDQHDISGHAALGQSVPRRVVGLVPSLKISVDRRAHRAPVLARPARLLLPRLCYGANALERGFLGGGGGRQQRQNLVPAQRRLGDGELQLVVITALGAAGRPLEAGRPRRGGRPRARPRPARRELSRTDHQTDIKGQRRQTDERHDDDDPFAGHA